MSAEETNITQANNLSALREAIEKRKEQFQYQQPMTVQETVESKYSDVPEITLQSTAEFQLERHTQLCTLIDVLYFNWKLSVDKNEQVEERLKALVIAVDDFLFESLKPRFS